MSSKELIHGRKHILLCVPAHKLLWILGYLYKDFLVAFLCLLSHPNALLSLVVDPCDYAKCPLVSDLA